MAHDAPNVFKTKHGKIIIILFFIVLAFLICMNIYDHVKEKQAPPEPTANEEVLVVMPSQLFRFGEASMADFR